MKYPLTKLLPTSVTFGRVTYTDNFQWLEEDTPESLEYQAVQDRLAQDWLSALPSHARSKKIVAAMPRVTIDAPLHCGGRWFRTHTPTDQNLNVIEMADSVKGPWRRIVDMNAMAKNEPLKVDTMHPSPDGRKLLFQWGGGGREIENFWVIDVDTGERLVESIRQMRALFPTWLPDSSGFYYGAIDPAEPTGYRVYRQMLGAQPATQAESFEPTEPFLWPGSASDKKHIFIISNYTTPKPDYIRDVSAGDGGTGGAWRPFLKGETAFFRGDIVGDRYYAITNDGAPCGRLVSMPLATPRDRSTWKELIPGSSSVLGTMQVVDDHLVVADLVDAWSRLRVFDAQGQLKGEVQLPGRGALCTTTAVYPNVIDMMWKGGKGEVLFHFSGPTLSPGLYKVDIHTMKVEVISDPDVNVATQIQSNSAFSADGARVPYHVIARPGTDLSKPRPTVIYGYGGFAVAMVPGWCGSWLAAWVQSGGVLVLAHLRGGAELGPQMWLDGCMKNKQNTFNDLYAIAEDLFVRRITTTDQLGIYGISNGGILVATVTVQRPELFRAGIAQVPITDVMGCTRNPVSKAISVPEFGDPDDPEMSEVLRAWSPYQNIKDGVSYPALLLDSGSNDPRCPPWHVRKMSARLQQANAGPHAILQRVRDGAGHGAVGSEAMQLQDTDFVAFFADQLGLAL